MTTYNLQDTEKEILRRLENVSGSSYFTLELNDEDVKVRVSDHSAGHRNNSGNTISFCTNFVKHSDSNPMINEFIVDEDGYSEDYGLDIIDILENELN